MIPNVEEVGGEPQRLSFRQLEILDEGKVPVLLTRTTESVPAEIAEIRGAEIAVRQTLCSVEQRSSSEGVDVQIPVVNAALNTPRGQSGGECAAGRQAAGKSARSK